MPHFKIETYIPADAESAIIAALNGVGALHEGPYDHVYASSEVQGHWRPLAGANPTIGEIGAVSAEPELKIEFRVREEKLSVAMATLRKTHPYETPVINVFPLVEIDEQ